MHVGPRPSPACLQSRGVTALDAARSRPGTLVVAAMLLAAVSLRFADDPVLPALLFLTVIGVVLARIDVEARRLPFALTVPALTVTAALLAVAGGIDGWDPVGRAVGSSLFWLGFYASIRAVTRGRGMGRGDVVLAPTLGLALGWLGWGHSMVGLGAGFLVAALVAVGLIAVGRATRSSSIPFGPFMLVGAAFGAFVGDWIPQGYLNT